MKLIKRILPDLIAILAFIIIPTIYFAPAAFEGRILAQHDSVAGIGNGQEAREYHENNPLEQLHFRRYAHLPKCAKL